MNSRHCLRIAVLLLLPAIASAEEPAKPTASKSVETAAQSAAAPGAISFDLKNPSVRNIVRAAATTQDDDQPVDDVLTLNEKLGNIRFRAPRRLHHTDCDSFDCVAYTADDVPLYSFSRDQVRDVGSVVDGDTFDEWLSCQSSNDLLTTFERFDRCRRVSVGPPPVRIDGVELLLPKIRL